MEKIKVQKYLSDSGFASRRHAEELIKEGRIRINGIAAQTGDRVDPSSDVVEADGIVIKNDRKKIYVLLNKPAGYVCSMSDEKGRKTVCDLVRDADERIYPVGRLDMYTEGIIILTNDGAFANHVMHPSSQIRKTYYVELTKPAGETELEIMSGSFEIEGRMINAPEIELLGPLPCSKINITIGEGRNREVRRICERAGLRIKTLRRISIGSIGIGSLPTGKWRYLSEEEIESLF